MNIRTKKLRGTLVGLTAILMWATLATLTAFCEEIPPFQLTAMAFTVATGIGLVWIFKQGLGMACLFRIPIPAWILGVSGLFGFHFFYFMALRNAPVIEASLISYLWPLLIVLFSSLLPGEQLFWNNIVGSSAGLLGAAILVSGGSGFSFNTAHLLGYGFALLCALTWSSYSVLSRLFQKVPSYSITGFCALTSLLALLCHLLFEKTVMPTGFSWLAILGLGLGPVGGAFYTWDIGLKTGDIKTLGVLSYFAPLLSTFLLLALGMAKPSWSLALACILIVGGSLLATSDMLKKQRRIKVSLQVGEISESN